MKTAAIIINIFFPGIGSFFVGKVVQGIIQIILYVIGFILILTGIGFFIGGPLCFIVWIWAIVTAATSPSQPVEVVVVHRNEPPSS